MVPFTEFPSSAHRLLVVLVLSLGVASCGGKSKGASGGESSDAGAEPPPPVLKVLHIALEYVVVDPDADPVTSRVALILTDETGASRRELVGEFTGGCSDVSRAARNEATKPILGLDCWASDRATKLRFAHRQNKLYIISAQVGPEEEPSYQPYKTIELPPGTPVRTDHDSAAKQQ